MTKPWPDAGAADFIPTRWWRSGTPMADGAVTKEGHHFVGGTLRVRKDLDLLCPQETLKNALGLLDPHYSPV